MIVDGYIRVSQVGNRRGASFISPKLQRERIEKWCALQGATIGELHQELDESGANPNRPLLNRALERVEAGETGGVVVARMDRFGRSLVDSLAAIERIDRAGGVFVSVDDGLDLTTNTGRLVLRIMLSLAEYELDRIRESWRDTARTAIARGVHICPKPPWGYQRGPEGRLDIDPSAAPHVRAVFERRAQGEGMYLICRYLESQQVRTATDNVGWTTSCISRILKNRVYLGEAHRGDFVNAYAHPAIIDTPTFYQAQRPRHERLGDHRRHDLLTGFIRCSGCRMKLYGKGTAKVDCYCCKVWNASGRCPEPASIVMPELDDFVVKALLRRLRAQRHTQESKRRTAVEARLEKAQAAVDRYRDNARLELTIGADRYIVGLEKRVKTVEKAALALASERPPATPPMARAAWDELDRTQQRSIIRSHIDAVFVGHGRLRTPERVFICWHGEAPIDLPRRGRQQAAIRPFNPDDCIGSAARRPRPRAFHPRWPEDELERRLREFCDGRTRFPDAQAFRQHGHGDLYEELALQGGRGRWATVLGLPTFRHDRLSDEQLQRALMDYLDGRTTMPRYIDFCADGERKLWQRLNRRGGLAHWAEAVGVRLTVTSHRKTGTSL